MTLSVHAVIVAFNSDIERLNASLISLTHQCSVVVVDNSTTPIARKNIQALCTALEIGYLCLGDNYGIAHAQNCGIEWVRNRNATDILLMDDDSLASKSLVSQLLAARENSQPDLCVLSARAINEGGKDVSNRPQAFGVNFTACSELTSSGTLISMSIFDLVGPFDEELFIDCVDFEWGWRAQQSGISLLLCNSITIDHRLGERERFGFKIPSPIRHYYQYRNILTLIFNSYAPTRWRLQQLLKLPLKILLIALLADRRSERLLFAIRGTIDFCFSKMGKYRY